MKRLKYLSQIAITISTIAFLILSSYLPIAEKAIAAEEDHAEEKYDPAENYINTNYDDPGDTDEDSGRNIDPIQIAAENIEAKTFDKSGTFAPVGENEYLSKISIAADEQKLVLNPSDLQDIRTLACLGNAMPDFANNDDSLSAASGKTIDQIIELRNSKPDDYKKLVENAQEASRKNITANLKTDVKNFACIAGVEETFAADMMNNDKESVDAIIDYAQNKIVIDKRVLKLLVNLVTPKDQGGAGHERIRVYRLRNNYTRDARMYSRESDAIYEQIKDKKTAEIQTIGDVAAADRNQLDGNSEFASNDAQAAVVDAAGRNKGDLIFNDTEDEANISAHYKGEAVDISEVDNMKCTLVKKKRLGSDKKIAQPPTPIKLAWQTSEGYDNSPPPDYSSLSMNLRQIASGQYLDMLDELGIDPDSEEDLSDAGFGDIASLIGESLLAEILNSPTNSLSGYSLSDTVRKIGGMILADKLDLPRQPFIEANLLNLSDLETKLGEAALEKKLNLYYGSIRGANLADTLKNIGLRNVEKQIGVPQNTITSGMDPVQMKLAIGRRTIEEQLKLVPGTFKAETTYSKLKEATGDRKTTMLFTTPSEIDDLLGIDINEHYSEKYKNGQLSADNYALTVGGKILANNVYVYNFTSSSANALNLKPVSGAGIQGIDQGGTIGNNVAQLTEATSTAKARLKWIMSGQLTADEGILPPSNFDQVYQQLGAETLASALSTNSEVRVALSQWLNTNALSSQTNCPISTVTNIVILKPGTTTGEVINVPIPEDQIMATYGLRRGDLGRLFGCYNSSTSAVFKSLGEKLLLESIKDSTIAEQARAKFLADHPEITNFLNDVEFYRSRIELIKSKTAEIKNDWNTTSDGNADIQAIISQINSAATSIAGTVGIIDTGGINLANLALTTKTVRDIPVLVDQILSAVSTAQNGSDQSLRDRANNSLSDITEVVHAVDEILAGEAQPGLDSLQINDINSANRNSGTDESASATINRATMALMLSGRLTPKDFLTSVGSNLIEDSLNLPTNGILYFAKYLESPAKNNDDSKSAFFRAIGQAQVEETFSLPPFFFQGGDPAGKATLTDVKIHIANSFNISEAEAGAKIMQALSLPGDFSTIERNTAGSLSSLVLAANNVDGKLGISSGTTGNFLSGKPQSADSLGASDIRALAGKLFLPEKVVTSFTQVKNGSLNIDDAKKDDYSKNISFNPHNEFARKQVETSAGSTPGQCPVQFGFDLATKTFTSNFIQDNSYIYTNRDGTYSFPTLKDAQNYANKIPDNKQVDFTQAISIGIIKAKGNNNPTDQQIEEINNKLVSFVSDKNQAEAFPETDLVAMADMIGIPVDTMQSAFERKEIKEKAINSIPIAPYLEIVGRKTAERRITSALLGSMSMTFGGLQIDATDIFDALNGNSTAALVRIGSRYIEDQLNIPQNTIVQILESPNTILRNCSLSKIGSDLIGSALDVGSVSLSGNIYDNIGGAKIENTLGLPETSFRGTSIDELISSIGAAKFAAVFYLPPAVVTPTSVVDSLLDDQSASQLSLRPLGDQSDKIDNLLSGVESIGYTTPSVLLATDQSVDTLVRNFVHDGGNYAAVANAGGMSSDSGYQISRFQNRLKTIDSLVGFDSGSFEKMFHDTAGYSPNDLRKKAAKNALLDKSADILTALGLDSEAAGIVSTVMNMQRTIDTIKVCGGSGALEGAYSSGSRPKCDYGYLYSQLSQLFGVNFDAKIGLPAGTIASIIVDPQQAAFKILSSALTRFDESLGLTDGNGTPYADASFTYAFGLWYNQDYKNCTSRPGDCLANSGNDDTTFHDGFLYRSSNRWEIAAGNIGTQLLANYLGKIGIIAAPTPGSGSYAGFPDTATLLRQSTDMLVRGDLRILAVTAGVKALEALNIYDDGKSMLPNNFRVSFEDVYYAVMGNPLMENQYAAAAGNNFLASLGSGSATSTIASPAEMAGSATSYLYGSQCPPGVNDGANCDVFHVYNPANDSYTSQSNGFRYLTYSNVDAVAAKFAAENPGSPNQALLDQIGNTPDAKNTASLVQYQQVQELARSQARQDIRNNLMWRMADAKLYQLDKSIPLGFSKTMFKGTGSEKTAMLLSYADNALQGLSIGGVSLGDLGDMVSNIKDIRAFISNPTGVDLDILVKNGKLQALDGWLNDKFSDFLGFDLQPGTFEAAFYGLKKGTFTFDDFNVGGTTIKSLTSIYSDWATSKITAWGDQALGLPSGTVYTAYSMYKDLVTAKDDLFFAELFGDETDITAAEGNVDEVTARLISFIITTAFSKQIAAVESALGLVPGTGALLVSSGISYLMSGAIPWIGIAMFVIQNLFGVYKVELWCTADGYYPKIDDPAVVADPAKVDNGSLGTFDGMNAASRKAGYIAAAQYKARTLIGDALSLGDRIGDPTAVPTQIMTGRQEDVDYWNYKITDTICAKVGGCEGTNAGAWQNPGTTTITHIGF